MGYCIYCYLKYIPLLLVLIFYVQRKYSDIYRIIKDPMYLSEEKTRVSRCGKSKEECCCFKNDEMKPKESQ